MMLRTYCLRGDKVLNVPNLFSRVDHTGSLYGSAVYFFYFVSRSGGSVTSLQVMLARKAGGISYNTWHLNFAE